MVKQPNPKRYAAYTYLTLCTSSSPTTDELNHRSAFLVVTGRLGTNGGSLPRTLRSEGGAQVISKPKSQQRDLC